MSLGKMRIRSLPESAILQTARGQSISVLEHVWEFLTVNEVFSDKYLAAA
jgi:hypothetical protein